jgi:hypothetical protein
MKKTIFALLACVLVQGCTSETQSHAFEVTLTKTHNECEGLAHDVLNVAGDNGPDSPCIVTGAYPTAFHLACSYTASEWITADVSGTSAQVTIPDNRSTSTNPICTYSASVAVSQ